jgi:hypothetical protein
MHDKKSQQQLNENPFLTPTYASREMTEDIPKHRFPEHSTAPGMMS